MTKRDKISYTWRDHINEDGSVDESKSGWVINRETKKARSIPDEELKRKVQTLSMELRRKPGLIRRYAKEHSITQEQMLFEARDYAKEQIRSREKGNLRHFHITSFENFAHIAAEGALLSRTKLKERHPEIDIPAWSASDDVMMTRDVYNKEGKLVRPGISEHGIGALKEDITFIFSSAIMDRDDYDGIDEYPTISELPLSQYCEAVLVAKPEDVEKTKKVLKENDLDAIPVLLKGDWSR
ncbi:MAG: hypothetical protein ABH846_03000 [Patescibacteria group bacterium]